MSMFDKIATTLNTCNETITTIRMLSENVDFRKDKQFAKLVLESWDEQYNELFDECVKKGILG